MTDLPESVIFGRHGYESLRESGIFPEAFKPWAELPAAEQARFIAMAEAVAAKAREQDDAPSTVTVATMHGTRETWDASLCASIDGALVIGDSYADGSLVPLAAWAPGEWRDGGRDDRRVAPSGTDHKARADAAEQVIREVRHAAGDNGESFYARVDNVLAILARHENAARENGR